MAHSLDQFTAGTFPPYLFSVIGNSKEIGKNSGAISHSSQFSTNIILITKLTTSFVPCMDVGVDKSEFVAISHFLFHFPESVDLALLELMAEMER